MQQVDQALRDELAEWVQNLERSDKRGPEYEKFSALHMQILFGADVYQELLDALNDAIRVSAASNAVFDKMTPPTLLPPADRKIFKTALHHMRLSCYYSHEQMIEQQKVYVRFAAYGGLVKNVPRHELPKHNEWLRTSRRREKLCLDMGQAAERSFETMMHDVLSRHMRDVEDQAA